MRAALVLVWGATALVACRKEEAPPPPLADAAAQAPAALFDGPAVVEAACLSCHTREMIAQQRLTEAQWTKVVTKMATWGANLDPAEAAPLAKYLAATYGVDAGPFEPVAVSARDAVRELEVAPDGAFAGGDADRGRALYTERCSACHGPAARGQIGVLLVQRPLLHRAEDFAATLRRGKGKMPPMVLSDVEVGHVLAHLRRLTL